MLQYPFLNPLGSFVALETASFLPETLFQRAPTSIIQITTLVSFGKLTHINEKYYCSSGVSANFKLWLVCYQYFHCVKIWLLSFFSASKPHKVVSSACKQPHISFCMRSTGKVQDQIVQV